LRGVGLSGLALTVMVGLGPSAQADIRRRAIHEFHRATPRRFGKFVDGRAKHDHD
jgi:hypothetical protein